MFNILYHVECFNTHIFVMKSVPVSLSVSSPPRLTLTAVLLTAASGSYCCREPAATFGITRKKLTPLVVLIKKKKKNCLLSPRLLLFSAPLA